MSSSATPTCLPQELVDSIIDELKNDVPSLRSCSLVSKLWVYRSRKYLFQVVHLPPYLLQRWLGRISTSPLSPLDPHRHVRSLFCQPILEPTPFCIPEALVYHLSSFTQVSTLTIATSAEKGWTDAFSDRHLVKKYFGAFGQALRSLELTRVHLNMVALKALLDVFTHLERLLILSPTMITSTENSRYLRESQSTVEAETSDETVSPNRGPVRFVDSITLLLPPTELAVCMADLPLRCRELVLTEDVASGGDVCNLLLNSTGPTLESLVIQNTLDRDPTVTLEHCPNLRKLTTKSPHHNIPSYINSRAGLIRTITSTCLEKINLFGKWDDSHAGRTTKWLEPGNWEMVDRELCELMDRLEDGIRLEVGFVDGVLSTSGEFRCVDCEGIGGVYDMLLNGVRTRGGTVKVQKVEQVRYYG